VQARESEQEHKQGEWQAEGEAVSLLGRGPDVGLDPRTPTRHELKPGVWSSAN